MQKIEHVSDTALMVCACRALENDRHDGLVRDRFASKLAGEKGMAIARSDSGFEWMCLGTGVRSRFIDDLVDELVRERGIRTVVNLGAGLDTRPWRMDLPAALRWIEVDFPDMLNYKAARLEGEQPRCALERIPADLSVPADRSRVFDAAGSQPALMITEGLLMYLPRTVVNSLGAEAASKSGVRFWLFDATSVDLMRRGHPDMMDQIDAVRAADHLSGREIVEAVEGQGWNLVASRTYARDSAAIALDRITKLLSSGQVPAQRPADEDPSGVYLFSHRANQRP